MNDGKKVKRKEPDRISDAKLNDEYGEYGITFKTQSEALMYCAGLNMAINETSYGRSREDLKHVVKVVNHKDGLENSKTKTGWLVS